MSYRMSLVTTQVLGWTREDVPSHRQRWLALLQALSAPPSATESSCLKSTSGGAIYKQ
ncbi:hypothetical protein [Ensifer sp. LCM 4579]|uniref:hypothetical protein n=1 Tax=Ensifer sp. LCM 4579 TaxID=1848292 RepID=UPI000A9F76F4|nr:hypothetical protein [Ensifer sp. LCM 4579]